MLYTSNSSRIEEVNGINPFLYKNTEQNLWTLPTNISDVSILLFSLILDTIPLDARLVKVRHSISKIESAVMKKIIPKPEDNTTLCKKCEVNNINCLLHPCSHVVLCVDCTTQSTRCPVCHKFIDYYDKIYLPNVNWG